MKLVAAYLVTVGVAIAGLWTVLLATGQVPEVDEGRLDIWFHLAAELLTAALLVAAGAALLRRWARGRLLAAVALGALGYTTVNSAGYYADAGDWAMVGMFAVLTACTLLAAIRVLRDREVGAGTGTAGTAPASAAADDAGSGGRVATSDRAEAGR